ncbi:MAG TPA: SpoIIE family protein phosphatase [Thermoanaerobaculia bacterium]|nr:SpoIIE family protein phosphatase [Thermoanaerobaculia bacterium]
MTERVLVVDDGVMNRQILASILGKAGLECLLAGDGGEALRCARESRPDLVLLDVVMPGKNGYEVCAELKADPETADIPVIFLSSLDEAADKIRGLSAGAADYVAKPFDAGEVLARVKTQLRMCQLTRSLQSLNHHLIEKQRCLDEDLQAAAHIQSALIPRPGFTLPGVALSWLFVPSSAVGGDIFNALQLDAEHVAFYILDVNGHGVPPAMIALLAWQSLSPAMGLVVHHGAAVAPAEVLCRLETEYPYERFERYFTISYLLLHVPSGRLTYSTAAHPFPLLLRREGTLQSLEEGGSIVGLGLGLYEQGEVVLERGDRLFLYTDGIVEFESATGEFFGDGRLRDVLRSARPLPLAGARERLREALESFGAGVAAGDDISFLALEYHGLD